jgi:Ca2+-binding RTX toxin-like protein
MCWSAGRGRMLHPTGMLRRPLESISPILPAIPAGDSYTEIEGIIGSQFGDRLIGEGASNRIRGGLGRDVMTGGAGPDVFLFGLPRDSQTGGRRDIITDFQAGSPLTSVDKINVSEIDAVAGPGNQVFRFIGTAAFSGSAGELRLQVSGTSTIVMGDVNGDASADFEIELQNFTNTAALTAIDFMR